MDDIAPPPAGATATDRTSGEAIAKLPPPNET